MSQTKAKWTKPDGSPVSCTEKIKVLNENYREIQEAFLEALDDAVLMGCSIEQVKKVYIEMIEQAMASYPEQKDKEEE